MVMKTLKVMKMMMTATQEWTKMAEHWLRAGSPVSAASYCSRLISARNKK